MIHRKNGRIKKGIAYLLIFSMVLGMAIWGNSFTIHAATAGDSFSLAQAISLATSNSRQYKKTKSKLMLQEVKYIQAQKSVQLKMKSMLTFRWSPLLNFHFPETPELSEEYSWVYKPMQIQYQIVKLNHEQKDVLYAAKEEVSNIYVQVYTAQEKIAYYEEYLSKQKATLEKNKAKYYVGTATKEDIASMEKKIAATEKNILAVRRNFETAKQKLSDLINMDVSRGYIFTNPYVEAEISRSFLHGITEYTLENSHSYFEAKVDTELSRVSLNINYDLMRDYYGNDIKMLSNYMQSVLNYHKVDEEAFKTTYDKFLKKIDSYWEGKFRILFIKFPKEWLKGELDGTRYIDDDPYILYTGALEYIDYWNEQEAVEKEITQNVRDSFDNLVIARNAYLSLKEQTEELKKDMQEAKIFNELGKISFQEYSDAENLYQESMIDEMEALSLYTQTLYSFDRLTCGAVTSLLNGEEISLDAVSGGMSFVEESQSGDAEYYIVSKIENSMFELGLSVPEDFATEFTHFELWMDGQQIGTRTETGKVIRHLKLTTDTVKYAFIRLYNEDEFVADCEIDVYELRGVLKIPDEKREEMFQSDVEVLGRLSYYRNAELNLITIKIIPESSKGIAYYSLADYMDNVLASKDLIDINTEFSYFSFMESEFLALSFRFYDADGNYLFTGYLGGTDMTIRKY